MKKSLIVAVGVVILVLVIVMTWIGLAPMYKLRELEAVASEMPIYSVLDSLYDSQSLAVPTREQAHKSALVSLLVTDSIQLIVNLRDTLVGLYINGIMVHRTKPSSFQIDPVFLSLSNRAYLSFFSKPIAITVDTASIVKEPIVVREAPKDTLEASLNAYKPDTLIQNPAFWRITLSNDLHIIFAQHEDQSPLDKQVRSDFFGIIRKRLWADNLSRFFSFRRAAHAPMLVINLPVDDLRAIYRAVPDRGKVVVSYN